MARSATLTAMLGAGALALMAAFPIGAQADVSCARVVAASGDDAAAGTAAAPFRTVQRLTSALLPGQTGCVRGTVPGNVWIVPDDVTVTSEPGQRGRIAGQVIIDPDAGFVKVTDLDLDATGVGRPSPIVLGDDATIARNDITNNHTPILCMSLGAKGHDSGARADRTRIEGNRIHDCGVSDNHRHGIYVEHALDTHIIGNEIFGNADRGIQLYPDAQGTLIEGNVIEGNGQGIIFSGSGGTASSNTIVRYNVLTNPTLRASVESWYPAGNPIGTNNVVEQNCVSGDRLIEGSKGFTARDNLFVDPRYVDRASRDFRLEEGSPCAALLAAGRAGITIPKVEEPAAPAAPSVPAPPQSGPAPQPVPPPTIPTPTATKKPRPSKDPRTTTAATAGAVATRTSTAPAVRTMQALPRVKVAFGRRSGRAARLRLRLAQPSGKAVRVLVELRWRGRSWRVAATPVLQGSRAKTLTVKVPRGVRGLRARAVAVEETATVTRVPLRAGRAAAGV